MTTLDLLNYYVSLLIKQYGSLPKARATIASNVSCILLPQTTTEEITFSNVPSSGAFTLSYDGVSTSAISWNASIGTIQSVLRAIPALAGVTASGEISSQLIVITFMGVIAPANLLTLVSSTLADAGHNLTTVQMDETDLTLPLAVLNGYNLTGDDPAQGVQLDILGKYAGVKRTSNGIYGQITLGDSDFLLLIQFAVIINNSGSSLGTIAQLLYQFFGNQVYVFDYKNFHMSYLINSTLGTQDLIQVLVAEGLLPRPMAVALSVVYAPVIDEFFGFRTYTQPAFLSTPFNSYSSYNTNWKWLSYQDSFTSKTSLATEDGNLLTQENGGLIYLG